MVKNKMAAILFGFGMVRTIRKPNFQNGRSKLGCFINKEEIYIYIKRPRLAIVRISNGPDHSKTEHKMADHSKTEHHSKTEQTPTIRIPNLFGIRAPTVYLK